MLNCEIKRLLKINEDLKDEINIIKAGGNAGILCDLREEYDGTFDSFFDEVRFAYEEEDEDLTNEELLNMFGLSEKRRYIEFIENYNEELEDELNELKELR